MELEKKVKNLDGMKPVRNQEGPKSSSFPKYQGNEYKGMQISLAQHSVDYCGDGMGDGCTNN